MRKYFYILSIVFASLNAYSEEILRSTIVPLAEDDYNKPTNESCKSFSKVLIKARDEWRHVTPFKLTEESLNNFLVGYNLQEDLVADIITVWPQYQGRRDQYYVLIGNKNCFVRWLELLPNSIQEIINSGVKAKINKI